ncbi:MAG: peptidoglycan-binding protein, partial [Nitrospinota bacterium]
MYLHFYHFRKSPFHITPDPEFLFLSPSHKEALGTIIYGIEERKGFVAIIGEVGLGKTTILRSYLEKVDPQKVRVIYILNPNVSFADLVRIIYQELGLQVESEDLLEQITRLYHVLIEEYKAGRNVVLVIDEAQNMPVETLENLRMLSNLETATDKLIQIVLVGQPELEEKLNRHELRQLRQRIAIRATIVPLTQAESMAYIQHRLALVSMRRGPIFTKGALKLIVKQAKGVPRTLNILCDNALIAGFGYQQKPITTKIAKEVIADFEQKPSHPLLR